jgi:hypothetical protein
MAMTSTRTIHGRRLLAACMCGLALAWMAFAGSAEGQGTVQITGQPDGASTLDSASLVQCLTATEPAERSATFAGEMTTIPGATRMSMRIELLERMGEETGYHTVAASAVGVWHTADPDVKTYKHLEQFTNLSAPAFYRALISFRWQGPHGRVIKRDERRTSRCSQPAPMTPSSSSSLE